MPVPAPRLRVVRLSKGVPTPLAKLSVPPVKAAPLAAASEPRPEPVAPRSGGYSAADIEVLEQNKIIGTKLAF